MKLVLAGAATALFGLSAAGACAEEPPMSPAARALTYCHLYADAHGVSHFRDEQLTFAANPAAAALAAQPLTVGTGATLLSLRRGAKEDWHTAPRRMYLIALTGMSEVTAGDGEVRRFAPGSVVLMDDTTGKGHITRSVGTEDHIALTIPAPAPAAAPATPATPATPTAASGH